MTKKLICFMVMIMLLATIIPSFAKEEKILLEFKFDKPTIKRIGNEYRIELEGCYPYNYKGLMIPVKPVYILLPFKKDVKKIVVKGEEKFIGNYNLEKEKPIIIKGRKIEIKHGNKIEKLYEKVGIYGLRGYNILVMNIFPISYDNGKIFYRDKIKVEIELKEGKVNPLYRGLKKDKEWIRKFVYNPWIIDTYPTKNALEEYEYLIITANDFKEAFQQLAEYKESKGIKTKIVSVEEIVNNKDFWNKTRMFNDTQAKIRNFIRYAYLNWGIDYVLLGGDGDIKNESSNIIPPRYLYATSVGLPLDNQDVLEAYIPSDVYYACLDGSFNNDHDTRWGENATENSKGNGDEADLFAEVWVGRACVDNIKEVNNFIQKTISYEETTDNYIIQVLLLGEYLGFGGEAEWGGNHKDEVMKLIPPVYNITRMYDKLMYWDKYNLADVINNGVHIINHDGHGWTTYALKLHNSDLKLLHNTKYFFLYSQTCLAGSFDNWYPEDRYYEDDCFAEHLTCDEYGAFACIMNSRYGLGRENSTDSPGQRYDLSFFKGLFEEDIKEVGRANHFSKEDNVWRINENGMRWTYYQTNLFGDPQVAIKEPEEKINISLEITKPLNGLYVIDRGPFFSFINKTIILGGITIKVNVETDPPGKLEKVNFYINDELKVTVSNEPFEWKWDEKARGEYKIKVVAYATNGKSEWDEREVFIINL